MPNLAVFCYISKVVRVAFLNKQKKEEARLGSLEANFWLDGRACAERSKKQDFGYGSVEFPKSFGSYAATRSGNSGEEFVKN